MLFSLRKDCHGVRKPVTGSHQQCCVWPWDSIEVGPGPLLQSLPIGCGLPQADGNHPVHAADGDRQVQVWEGLQTVPIQCRRSRAVRNGEVATFHYHHHLDCALSMCAAVFAGLAGAPEGRGGSHGGCEAGARQPFATLCSGVSFCSPVHVLAASLFGKLYVMRFVHYKLLHEIKPLLKKKASW